MPNVMKVAIIDDAQINVTLLQHLVRKLENCEPVCFTDPIVGLAWCLENAPDLVVVDYMMPQLSGIDLTEKFRERYPDIPVLMVTANHETELRHRALRLRSMDFLNKPLDNNEFLARAKNMLDLNQTRKKLSDRASWLKEEVDKATAEIAARNEEILLRERETIICLAKAAEYRDPETGAHILRMAHYSKHIARYMGLATEEQDILLDAAPMHDVGKVGIADLILLKPGKLNETEFAIMKEHAVIGYKILNESTSDILKVAAEIAWTHHEKYDGTGYPRQLKKDEIPLFGRIVAVADVFDALTSERPYKKAWSVEQATQYVKDNSGSHFDPACVEAFFTEFDEVLAIKNQFIDDQLEPRNRMLE